MDKDLPQDDPLCFLVEWLEVALLHVPEGTAGHDEIRNALALALELEVCCYSRLQSLESP